MEVILREHIDNLGRRGDVVKVAAGYARNYLLPRKLALAVTENNKRQIEREKKLAEARDMEEKSAAEAIAARITALDIEIGRHRPGAEGQGVRHRQAEDHPRRPAQGARRDDGPDQDPP